MCRNPVGLGAKRTRTFMAARKLTAPGANGAEKMAASLNRARGEDGLGHAVNNFLIGGTDGGEEDTQVRTSGFGFDADEIVGAKPHRSAQRDQVSALESKPQR